MDSVLPYNERFYVLHALSLRILTFAFSSCLPFRKRVAEDVVLIDGLFWSLITGPLSIHLFFAKS